ncbi:MAG TPA: response regulator transcription factor [Crocinitomix sp.]|nr:response regulator transcription factor [Crocinitomix sp.]
MKEILLVEDEESLTEVLTLNLTLEDFKVTQAKTGTEALRYIHNNKFDLIVLDIMLPEVNGFDICEIIRKEKSDVPILFISAKGTSTDRIKGLSIGADDYLVKPFHLDEFLLRVKNLINRFSKKSNTLDDKDKFVFGNGYSVDFKTYEVDTKNGKLTLSKREIELLKLLISKKNEVVSRENILNALWSENSSPNSRTIDNYILNLRKHFEDNPKIPKYFISLRGVGYKFVD